MLPLVDAVSIVAIVAALLLCAVLSWAQEFPRQTRSWRPSVRWLAAALALSLLVLLVATWARFQLGILQPPG